MVRFAYVLDIRLPSWMTAETAGRRSRGLVAMLIAISHRIQPEIYHGWIIIAIMAGSCRLHSRMPDASQRTASPTRS